MSSLATSTVEVTAPPAEALAAVRRVLEERKCKDVQPSPDGTQLTFVTRKTMLLWELDGLVAVVAHGAGSRIDLHLDTVAGRPKALLDGKKNRKAADKLAEDIRAALA